MRHANLQFLRSSLAGGLALIAITAHASSWDPIEQIAGQSPVPVSIDGKSRLYFRVDPGRPLTLVLTGPSRLRIVSRAVFASGAGVASYVLSVHEGSREIERSETESSPSDRASAPGIRGIGKRRRMTIDVPSGTHQLGISTSTVPLFVRLHRAAPQRGEQPMVSLTPIDAPRSVLVTENEKIMTYYTLQPGRRVRLRVVGPTSLDVISRLDFDATMRGPQKYRIRISEGSRLLREVEYRTTKATAASYRNLKDRIPSKFDRLHLVIPEGLHELYVELVSPRNGSAEIHARIPQPQIGGEE